MAGCYEIGIKHISNETGYSSDKVEKVLDRLSKVHKVIKYNNETKELLIINWHKYNWTGSPKVRALLLKELESIKCPEFKRYLMDIFNDADTVSDIAEYGIDTTDTVTETVTVPEKKTRSVFTPPTVEEVKAYCQERKNNVDPERFVDFYTTKGWRVGKDPMKDWKACVRTWEKNSNTNGQQQLKPAVTTNKFQQFPQREYTTEDYDALERRKLLGK